MSLCRIENESYFDQLTTWMPIWSNSDHLKPPCNVMVSYYRKIKLLSMSDVSVVICSDKTTIKQKESHWYDCLYVKDSNQRVKGFKRTVPCLIYFIFLFYVDTYISIQASVGLYVYNMHPLLLYPKVQ
jgi:hypothetical protein